MGFQMYTFESHIKIQYYNKIGNRLNSTASSIPKKYPPHTYVVNLSSNKTIYSRLSNADNTVKTINIITAITMHPEFFAFVFLGLLPLFVFRCVFGLLIIRITWSIHL